MLQYQFLLTCREIDSLSSCILIDYMYEFEMNYGNAVSLAIARRVISHASQPTIFDFLSVLSVDIWCVHANINLGYFSLRE